MLLPVKKKKKTIRESPDCKEQILSHGAQNEQPNRQTLISELRPPELQENEFPV